MFDSKVPSQFDEYDASKEDLTPYTPERSPEAPDKIMTFCKKKHTN